MELIVVFIFFFGLSYFMDQCAKHNQRYTKKTSTHYQPSKKGKKPDNTLFYIIGIIAVVLALSGVGSIIGIPLLAYVARHAFWEAEKRDKRYEEEQN